MAELEGLFQGPNKDGRSGPGSGLGLYVARAMAESIGGRVQARQSPGRGLTLFRGIAARRRRTEWTPAAEAGCNFSSRY